MFDFKKAERKKAKLRLALCGPSGSGKTYSALLIAKGLGGKVALIDTEKGSGDLYADNPEIGLDYYSVQFTPPYSPERAVAAIRAAKDAGFDVVIFDSLSHIWMGEGGLLDMVDLAARSKRGNSFAAWKEVKPHEKKFLEALTGTDIHIIATMRTKTAWEVEKDERTGKTRPVKVGMKPEQREGLEYEFTLVLDLSVDGNVATASKDRTSLFRGRHFVPSEETGRELLAWLNAGSEPEAATPTSPAAVPAPASQDRPARGEMIARGWNRIRKIAGDSPERLAKARAWLSDLLKRDLQGENPLAGLPDEDLARAWDAIAQRYAQWQQTQGQKEAA